MFPFADDTPSYSVPAWNGTFLSRKRIRKDANQRNIGDWHPTFAATTIFQLTISRPGGMGRCLSPVCTSSSRHQPNTDRGQAPVFPRNTPSTDPHRWKNRMPVPEDWSFFSIFRGPLHPVITFNFTLEMCHSVPVWIFILITANVIFFLAWLFSLMGLVDWSQGDRGFRGHPGFPFNPRSSRRYWE
jgi:hypothetical protein